MKNLVIVAGFFAILLNTVCGLIIQDYPTHCLLFADFSIILTTGLLFLIYQMKSADGFKIGYTFLLSLTGLIRLICAISSSNEFKNNYAALIFIIVLCFECFIIFVSHAMRKN